MNLDSTQAIWDATISEGEFFRFVWDEKVIAEAAIPNKVSADFIESWCNHVRKNMAALRPSDAELAARKQRNREHGPIDTEVDSGRGDSGVHDSNSTSDMGNIGTETVRAFEESPDEIARATVTRLTERQAKLEEELKANGKLLAKWDAILTAIENTEDEDDV